MPVLIISTSMFDECLENIYLPVLLILARNPLLGSCVGKKKKKQRTKNEKSTENITVRLYFTLSQNAP